MNCAGVRSRMSAYFDDELDAASRKTVAAHLEACTACADELASFASISATASKLDASFARDVRTVSVRPSRRAAPRPAAPHAATDSRRAKPVASAAAASVVAAAMILVAWLALPDRGSRASFAIDFDRYASGFAVDPEGTQKIIVATHSGRRIAARDAAHEVGWEPSILHATSAGNRRDVFVLCMHRCVCVQTLSSSGEGVTVAAFEYDADQPEWFGERPAIESRFGDTGVKIVQFGDRLAATWHVGERKVTVVGLPNLDAVADWIERSSATFPL